LKFISGNPPNSFGFRILIPIINQNENAISKMDTPSSASDDPPKFTLFPKVPIELRRMIWKRAIPKGRLILVRAGKGKKGDLRNYGKGIEKEAAEL
jgi:hypothetical protein